MGKTEKNNIVFFLLGDSLACEGLCTDILEHSVCSIFIGVVSRKKSRRKEVTWKT